MQPRRRSTVAHFREDLLPARLVVLASGQGRTLQALLDAAADPAYGAAVVAVGSDRPDAPAHDRAAAAGVPTFTVEPGDFADRESWDRALAEAVATAAPDLVVCAGFMRLLGADFLARFPVVNTHPALLPAFPGTHAVADALAYGVKLTGVTVHLVDEGVDTGPVVAQAAVAVLPGDTEATLHARIQEVEQPLYVDAVRRLAQGGWTVEGRTVVL
ncbi:MAG TPA: phosphoribosylglycinamide formyltransferase [Mycobacteriales bacterium]|nr:phosphoribosylglycinamide formyltransferase [Mycobacteriales bacterium]